MELKVGYFETKDCVHLHYQQWVPEAPQGAVVFVQGPEGNVEEAGPFVRYLTEKKFALFLFEQRGAGSSSGRPLKEKEEEKFCRDLESFCHFLRRSFTKEVPWFLVGTNFGGRIAFRYLKDHTVLFKSGCLVAPKMEIKTSKWRIFQKQSGNPFYYSTTIRTPLCLLHGSQDTVSSPPATRALFEQLPLAEKQLKIYEGKSHRLLTGEGKEEVFHDVRKWLEKFC